MTAPGTGPVGALSTGELEIDRFERRATFAACSWGGWTLTHLPQTDRVTDDARHLGPGLQPRRSPAHQELMVSRRTCLLPAAMRLSGYDRKRAGARGAFRQR